MANYRYKPYKRHRKNHNILYFLLAVIVIIAGVFWLRRSHIKNTSAEATIKKNISPIKLEPIEPEPEPKPIPAPAPQPQPAPAPQPQPAPAPKDEPQVISKPGTGTESDPTDVSSPEAIALIEEAVTDITAGDIIAARDKLNQTLKPPMKLSSADHWRVKEQMANLAQRWLFSNEHYPTDELTGTYTVAAGDMFSTIAGNYKVPYEGLMAVNNITDAKLLRQDMKIKVINGPFHAIVHRSTFTMDMYLQNTYVKTYRIGLGKPDSETPTGKWCVKRDGKLIKPRWTDPETQRVYIASDPDYPLGSRWIAIEGLEGDAVGRTGFALHGTKDPDTIGKRSSQGCVRLYNGDAIEVYNLLIPVHSIIRIVD